MKKWDLLKMNLEEQKVALFASMAIYEVNIFFPFLTFQRMRILM